VTDQEASLQERSAAQTFALVLGAGLLAAGLAGFFYNGDFTSNEAVHDKLLGLFSVNGWHNVLHVASGAIGLAVASSSADSRAYAYWLGALYLALALWGFVAGSGHSILGVVPVNTWDNALHLLIGVTGAAAGAAVRR
jgi:Domain of unknown function (DUF4383)